MPRIEDCIWFLFRFALLLQVDPHVRLARIHINKQDSHSDNEFASEDEDVSVNLQYGTGGVCLLACLLA
jgi:hypothetical protein